jgi:hypothetical protein
MEARPVESELRGEDGEYYRTANGESPFVLGDLSF